MNKNDNLTEVKIRTQTDITNSDVVYQYLINFKSGARLTAWFSKFTIDEKHDCVCAILPQIKDTAPPGLIFPEQIRVTEVESVWILQTKNAIEFYNSSDNV